MTPVEILGLAAAAVALITLVGAVAWLPRLLASLDDVNQSVRDAHAILESIEAHGSRLHERIERADAFQRTAAFGFDLAAMLGGRLRRR